VKKIDVKKIVFPTSDLAIMWYASAATPWAYREATNSTSGKN